MKTLVIVPCYNEEESIIEICKTLRNLEYDFIVVNDGSSDNSIEKIKLEKMPLIDLPINLGIGGAMQTGYKFAWNKGYDVAVQFDGDGQHDASYIEEIIKPIEKGYDLVIGSRFVEKGEGFKSTAARRIGIKLLSIVIRMKSRKALYDTTSGFRAVSRRVIKSFANDYPPEFPEPITNLEILMSDCKVQELQVEMHERKTGKSSISGFYKSLYYMFNVIVLMLASKGREL